MARPRMNNNLQELIGIAACIVAVAVLIVAVAYAWQLWNGVG